MRKHGTLGIGFTTKCNYSCRFCVIYNRKRLWGEIDTPGVRKILNINKNNYGTIVFGGGEPTLRTDLPKLVSYAKQLGYKVQISTNGRMFAYKDYCLDLVNAGTDVFCIGLSGHNAKLYEQVTQTRGSFSHVINGINNLLSLNQHVMTNTVISKHNYRFLPLITKFLIQLGHKNCSFSFVVRPPFMPKNEKFPQLGPRDMVRLIKLLKTAADLMIKSNIIPSITRVPFCYMEKYDKLLTDYLNNTDDSICLYQKGNRIVNVYDYVLFWKNNTCRVCKYEPICPGIQQDSPFTPRADR